MNKSRIGNIAIATGTLLNMIAGIMVIVQVFKVVGFSQLVLMNELGMWIHLFKADAGYSWLVISLGLVGVLVFFAGQVLKQMERDELRASKRFSF